jgi:hypothetical protein
MDIKEAKPTGPTTGDIEELLALQEKLLRKQSEAGGTAADLTRSVINYKRRKDAALEKASQPTIQEAKDTNTALKLIIEDFRRPMTVDELNKAVNGGIENSLISLQECLDTGNFHDSVLLAFRLSRAMWHHQFFNNGLHPDPTQWSDAAKKYHGR